MVYVLLPVSQLLYTMALQMWLLLTLLFHVKWLSPNTCHIPLPPHQGRWYRPFSWEYRHLGLAYLTNKPLSGFFWNWHERLVGSWEVVTSIIWVLENNKCHNYPHILPSSTLTTSLHTHTVNQQPNTANSCFIHLAALYWFKRAIRYIVGLACVLLILMFITFCWNLLSITHT